jgi:hypothetical protein
MGPMSRRGRRDCTGLTAGSGVVGRAVVHGPATAPQPVFQARVAGDVIQVCLPGAG